MDVNFFGTLLGDAGGARADARTRAAARSSTSRRSTASRARPRPAPTWRASSRCAGITKTAALELGRDAIRVNSVHPGAIATPMTSKEVLGFDPRPYLAKLASLGRVGEADEVAQMVVFLASDESSYCTGAEFVDRRRRARRPLLARLTRRRAGRACAPNENVFYFWHAAVPVPHPVLLVPGRRRPTISSPAV